MAGERLGFSFGGSKNKSKSGSSATETVDQVVTRLGSADVAKLNNLLATFTSQQAGGDAFSREAALRDVSGQVADLFSRYKTEAVPQILQAQRGSGGYASTTAQRLADSAFAQTVAQGAKLQTDAVKQYADIAAVIRQTGQQGIGIVLDALLQANVKSATTSVGKSATTGKSYGAEAGAVLKV